MLDPRKLQITAEYTSYPQPCHSENPAKLPSRITKIASSKPRSPELASRFQVQLLNMSRVASMLATD